MSYPLPPDRGYQAVYAVRPPFRGIAITGFVLAALGLLLALIPWVGAVFGVAGVICGHVALYQFGRDPRPRSGKGLAIASLPVGYVAVVIGVLITLAVTSFLNGFNEGFTHS